jgi:hypothetical protein
MAMAEGSLHDYRFCSLLVLSGGNMLRYLPTERDGRRVATVLGDLAPAERHRHLFRVLDRAVAASRLVRIQRDADDRMSEGPERTFARSVARSIGTFTGSAGAEDFGVQLVRAFVPFAGGEVHVFTACTGDASHLSALVRAARRHRITVVVHLPREVATTAALGRISRLVPDRVEVIR